MRLTFGQTHDLNDACRTLSKFWPAEASPWVIMTQLAALSQDDFKRLNLACQHLALFSKWLDQQEIILTGMPPVVASEPQRCPVVTHPGTEKVGWRCILLAGHSGRHQRFGNVVEPSLQLSPDEQTANFYYKDMVKRGTVEEQKKKSWSSLKLTFNLSDDVAMLLFGMVQRHGVSNEVIQTPKKKHQLVWPESSFDLEGTKEWWADDKDLPHNEFGHMLFVCRPITGDDKVKGWWQLEDYRGLQIGMAAKIVYSADGLDACKAEAQRIYNLQFAEKKE